MERYFSNIVLLKKYQVKNDWYLPSQDGLVAMYNELHLYGLGNFTVDSYWSSTEKLYFGVYFGRRVDFQDGGSLGLSGKGATLKVRACRSFTTTKIYTLRGRGQTGGLIFNITDNGGGSYTYYESAPVDSVDGIWSDNPDLLNPIPATATAIGSGQANTTAIITQVGHTTSAAKICSDLIT